MFMREDFYDPETHETLSITVSEVKISPDLRNATVYFMPLAGKNQECILQRIEELSPQIRMLISKRVQLRHMPALKFKLDPIFDRASHVDTILHSPKVQKDLASTSEES